MKELLLAYILLGGFLMTELPGIMVYDFSSPGSLDTWRAVNDTAMGGCSESKILSSGYGTALFTGTVSPKSDGGLCSVASNDNRSYNLGSCTGIAALVRGDGRKYTFTLNDAASPGFEYQFSFVADKGAWNSVRAPFREFAAFSSGMDSPGSPPVNPSQIRSFGLMTGDRTEGPFLLEIRWIKGY